MKAVFKKETFFSSSRKKLFAFHEQPEAFRLLTSAFPDITIKSTASSIKPTGEPVRFITKFLFLKFTFEMLHTEYEKNVLFVDEQQKGLFSSWRHEHKFYQAGWQGDQSSLLVDGIEFGHPFLFLFKPFVMHRLKKVFTSRSRITQQEVSKMLPEENKLSGKSIIVTGATGLIGKRITEILIEKGTKPVLFVRNIEKTRKLFGDKAEYALWDVSKPGEKEWKKYINNADGIIHLAGIPLFKQRWSDAFIKSAEQSRLEGTKMLVDAIANCEKRPPVFVSASAVGYYGSNPDRTVDESTQNGHDILADICVHWEKEAMRAKELGVRTAVIRIGIVLSSQSGALKEMLPLFQFGMGGVLGHPDYWFNWIHIEDIARIFVMALLNRNMNGAYNGVAPNPVQNVNFVKALGRAMHRPTLMRFPVWALKIIIGRAAEFLSGGPKASAKKVQDEGYTFFYDEVGPALENVLREGH